MRERREDGDHGRDADLVWIAEAMGATRARRSERIQSLWSGYGEIFRVALTGAKLETVIVKSVKPPARLRGSHADASHARKCRSYDVETRAVKSRVSAVAFALSF